MDPNATLAAIRNCVLDIQDAEQYEDFAPLAYRLSELVEAMDGWLTKGGFLPSDWTEAGR